MSLDEDIKAKYDLRTKDGKSRAAQEQALRDEFSENERIKKNDRKNLMVFLFALFGGWFLGLGFAYLVISLISLATEYAFGFIIIPETEKMGDGSFESILFLVLWLSLSVALYISMVISSYQDWRNKIYE